MINKMMYRVFLQDEKDAPSPSEDPEDKFRVRHGEMLAWSYKNPAWMPNLEEQLKAVGFGCVVAAEDLIDGHFIISCNHIPRGIVHTEEEIPDRTYDLAVREGTELSQYLSEKSGNPYVFIDMTSRGDRVLAERLSRLMRLEEIYVPSPRSVDIGD
jgi:hypothetical protein